MLNVSFLFMPGQDQIQFYGFKRNTSPLTIDSSHLWTSGGDGIDFNLHGFGTYLTS